MPLRLLEWLGIALLILGIAVIDEAGLDRWIACYVVINDEILLDDVAVVFPDSSAEKEYEESRNEYFGAEIHVLCILALIPWR